MIDERERSYLRGLRWRRRAALAIGLNIAMVEAFALEPLAWYVIPIGMLLLWIVGQLAVAGPARRASNITPAIATRSG